MKKKDKTLKKDLHDYAESSYEQWGKFSDKQLNYKTYTWFSSDTKKTFDHHMKKDTTVKDKWWNEVYKKTPSRELLEKFGWDKQKITYKMNNHGYRCDDFNGSRGCKVLFNGDSQTFGVGMNHDDTYPYLFARHYKIKLHNIAVPGSDWQHATQRACYWIPKLKPKYYILRALPYRFNWWGTKQDGSPTRISSSSFTEKEMAKVVLRDPENVFHKMYPMVDQLHDMNTDWYRYSMIELTRKICEDNDCEFILIDENRKYVDDMGWANTGLARDLDHFGKEWHHYIFNILLEKNIEL